MLTDVIAGDITHDCGGLYIINGGRKKKALTIAILRSGDGAGLISNLRGWKDTQGCAHYYAVWHRWPSCVMLGRGRFCGGAGSTVTERCVSRDSQGRD